jgi:hypothetical protein
MAMGYMTHRPELADGAAVQVMVDDNPILYVMGTVIVSGDGIGWLVVGNDGINVCIMPINEPCDREG